MQTMTQWERIALIYSIHTERTSIFWHDSGVTMSHTVKCKKELMAIGGKIMALGLGLKVSKWIEQHNS